MINCRSCRGSGERRCGCRDGWLSCEVCGGKGKVEEWLEVAEETFDRITLGGDDALAQAHSKGSDAVPLALSWRGSAVEDAPRDLQKILRRPDLAAVRPPEDRLREVSLEVFRIEITTVEYRLAGTTGSVRLQGWDREIVEDDSSRRPFEQRRRRTLQGVSAAVLAGAALTIWYGARHSFFLSTANYRWLWLLSLVLGLSVVPLLLWAALPKDSRRPKVGVLASLPVWLIALTQTGIAATGGPSLDHARTVVEQGRTEEALKELAACSELGIDTNAAARFHDEIQLARARQARNPEEAWKAASLPFLASAGREQARAHAVEVTFEAGAALQEKGEFGASAVLLDSAPVELVRTEPLLGLRRRVYLEEALPLWKVIQSRRQSLEEKVEACRAIDPQIRALAALPASSEGVVLEKSEVEGICESIREQRLRQIERQREAEAREAERARKRAEAAQKAAWRRWAYAPLLCNDGTRSPSCICGSSSHRGCCSWHGGVAGCSVDYPN